MRDMDLVLTTREVARWAKEAGIDFHSLPDASYDDIMGRASGAGVIFGNTGGVMEAALRTAYEYLTGTPAPEALYDLQPVRGYDGSLPAFLAAFTTRKRLSPEEISEIRRMIDACEKE